MPNNEKAPTERAPARTKRTSILFVALSLDRGGTEQHLIELLPRLVKKGWKVSVYCLATRGVRADEIAGTGVELIAPPMDGGSTFSGARGVFRAGLSSLKLGWLMLRRAPRIVHFFLPGPYLVGGPLAILTRRPIRLMSRRNLDNYLEGRPLIAGAERQLHRRMTAVLGNSQEICRNLENEGCDPRKIGKIYNGVRADFAVDHAARPEIRERLDLAADAVVALLVANLIPYKGHRDLIDALALIKDRLPAGFVVLCAGRDDGIGDELKRHAEKKGVAAHIRFLGSRRDVPELLAAADIGLLCSHEEGFSNSIIEAMVAGLPMIVTHVGGNPEAVIHEETGKVVPARSPEDLASALIELIDSKDLREKFGQASKSRAESQFSMAECIARYDALYLGLLEQAKAGKKPEDETAPSVQQLIERA